jgi:hypothetical protein
MSTNLRDAAAIACGSLSSHAQDLIECLLCATRVPQFSEQALAWDWFTGYFSETAHFCPDCRRSLAVFVNQLRALSQTDLARTHSLVKLREDYVRTLPSTLNDDNRSV